MPKLRNTKTLESRVGMQFLTSAVYFFFVNWDKIYELLMFEFWIVKKLYLEARNF